MSHITSFILGTIFGTYITQTYNIPDIKTTIDAIITKLKELEKENKNK